MPTIKAHFDDNLVMMFGDSYRRWWDQLGEYSRLFKRSMPAIQVSKEPWIGYGGLKWCPWENFQEELDEEGKGRKVSDFKFRAPTVIEMNCLKSEFK